MPKLPANSSPSEAHRSDQDFAARLVQTNQRLKLAQLGFQIEQRGQKLSLRGTLPPRPNSPRLRSHQQRLSLNLPATPAGLKQAEQTVKIIAAQLIQKTFDWRTYLPIAEGGSLQHLSLTEKLQAFQQHFLAPTPQPEIRAAAQSNWDKAYAPYLRKLEAIVQASSRLSLSEAIYATVQSTPAHSRSRQVCCTALAALAEFAQIDLPKPLSQYAGNYSPSRTRSRSLPTDAEILAAFDRIPNPAWRFVYGIMAAYGLRNHEVFFCDYSLLGQEEAHPFIEVLETTKTGSHEVWAFPPEWIDRFQLRQVCLPKLNTDLNHTTLQRIGQQVTQQFKRYEIPFSPYDLRHAWAVRTIHVGLPDSVAARMMGHSVSIHTRTYHRWLSRRDQQQAVHSVLNR